MNKPNPNEHFLTVLVIAAVVAFVVWSSAVLPPTQDGMPLVRALQDSLIFPLALLGVFMVYVTGVLFFAGGMSFKVLESWKERFPTASAIVIAAIIIGGALVLKVK